MSNYIHQRGDIFYYRRRVPEYVQPYETRKIIKISLRTSDRRESIRKAAIYNDYIEDYWRNLIKAGGGDNSMEEYRATVNLAKAHGFAYKSLAEIAKAPVEDIIRRLNVADKAIDNPEIVSSVLGGVDTPKMPLSECMDKFWPLCIDRITNKSEHQIRKWKNPRIAAINTLIEAIGDQSINQ